jgi:hypothetical protein
MGGISNTPVKENFCKNLFQTPKSNQNEGNDFENDEIQMEVCCPSGKEIPFSTLGNKSIMSLISIDSESHSGISFPEGQHTSI